MPAIINLLHQLPCCLQPPVPSLLLSFSAAAPTLHPRHPLHLPLPLPLSLLRHFQLFMDNLTRNGTLITGACQSHYAPDRAPHPLRPHLLLVTPPPAPPPPALRMLFHFLDVIATHKLLICFLPNSKQNVADGAN